MDDAKNKKWYRVLRAQHAIYTDPETGEIKSKNVVLLFGGVYRTFEYPQDGARRYLLKEGDEVLIEGSPHEGKIILFR